MNGYGDHGFARRPRGAGRWIAGVCGGLADRWQLPAWALRAAFVVAAPAFGAGVLLYAALVLAMPARGASAGQVARSAEVGRTLLIAARVVAAALALGATAALSASLALFGLPSAALLLACACVLALVIGRSFRPAPLGALAVVLTLPAAAVALSGVQVARQFGDEVVVLRSPADVDPAGYRAGAGKLLIDLRRFHARRGTTTTIRARADLRSLVVALPRNRCFALTVDQTLDRQWPARALDLRRAAVLHPGAPPRTPTTADRGHLAGGEPPSLVAFGAPRFGTSVRFERPATISQQVRPRSDVFTIHPVDDAPRLRLVLTTGRAQAIVRDYPANAQPLERPWWPQPHIPGAPLFDFPEGAHATQTVPDDPMVPQLLDEIQRGDGPFFPYGHPRTEPEARKLAAAYRLPVMSRNRRVHLRRFVAQELLLRAASEEGERYRSRLAGPCAPLRDWSGALGANAGIADANHANVKLTTRWAVIRRRWPSFQPRQRRLPPTRLEDDPVLQP